MKKFIIFLTIISIFFTSGCTSNLFKNESLNSEQSSSSSTQNSEYILTDCIGYHNSYELWLFKRSEKDEASHTGVFTGNHNLLIDLGPASLGGFFFEDDKFYLVGEYLVEYDLNSNFPDKIVKKVEILPQMTRVNSVESVDFEHIYADAFLMDEKNGRSERVILSINRDGTGYEILKEKNFPS